MLLFWCIFCLLFVVHGSVVWAVISRFYCWQRCQLEYKSRGKRGVWLAPAHLTLRLSAELLLVSGSYGGLTKCVRAQPSPLLPGRGWAGAPEAIYGLCGSTSACLCIQLVAIPVGEAVCAAVHEGGRVTLLFRCLRGARGRWR
jgi:hypothetical protein